MPAISGKAEGQSKFINSTAEAFAEQCYLEEEEYWEAANKAHADGRSASRGGWVTAGPAKDKPAPEAPPVNNPRETKYVVILGGTKDGRLI